MLRFKRKSSGGTAEADLSASPLDVFAFTPRPAWDSSSTLRAVFWVALGLAAAALQAKSDEGMAVAGPSFDCTKAHSAVKQLICASPLLSALDRNLAADFDNTRNQAGIDARSLRREEDQWLSQVRNRCLDADCLAAAYRVRDAQILDKSLRAASPAAYSETRPFPAPKLLWNDARALVGKDCGGGEELPQTTGYSRIPRTLPVISREATVLARQKAGISFAFLIDTRNDACRIGDVVVLPPGMESRVLLQCAVPDSTGASAPLSHGFAVRGTHAKSLDAYWEIDGENAHLVRQPLGVLGWDASIRCQQPESGE